MTPAFMIAVLLVVLGVALLLDHYMHHRSEPEPSKARSESYPWVCYFQLSDIKNHETWIIVCFTNAISLGLVAPMLGYELT